MDAIKKARESHPKAILFASAAAVRILLAIAFPRLPDLLTDRAEISTPINSFKRLQEGLFLYDRGLDPYDGGIFHQAPLLLPLFSLLPSPSSVLGQLFSVVFYTILDLLIADGISRIAASQAATTSSTYTSPRRFRSWNSTSVAAIYLLNPFTLLTCLARPTTVVTTFFTVVSIDHATQARKLTASFALAIASYLGLHPLTLLPPIALLCYDSACRDESPVPNDANDATPPRNPSPRSPQSADARNKYPGPWTYLIQFAGTFLLFIGLLFVLSRAISPSWNFLSTVYLTHLQLPDLTPNPGLWWYFFIEMFDAFRSFFLGVFWLHMLSYSVPFSLRLRKQPLAAVILMMGVCAIFEPYANLGDAGAWLSCLCLLGHVFDLPTQYRYTFPAIAALLYTSLLGPAFHYLWIYAGSGNANFFYAITLVWNLALLILLTDTLYAVLRDEWESERPEGKDKEVRQI